MEIGKRLQFYRRMCGLTHEQVAKALGKDRSSYTKYETGKANPNVDTLKRLASIFQVNVSDLVDDNNSMSAPLGYAPDSYHVLSAENKNERSLLVLFRQLSDEQKRDILKRMEDQCRERNENHQTEE
ncbi:MAG: helix-turn-helix domain-containing protein [Acutalibacteraceae bacterium]